jgi:hypothetical protein
MCRCKRSVAIVVMIVCDKLRAEKSPGELCFHLRQVMENRRLLFVGTLILRTMPTTQAQRLGLRDAWIAITAQWPSSLHS